MAKTPRLPALLARRQWLACMVSPASAWLLPTSAHATADVAAGNAPQAARPVASFTALQRPALPVRQPERAAWLAATQAGTRTVVVGERGLVLWSDNPAQGWQQARVPVSVSLTAVAFADAQRGWAVGHGGVVLATRDAGRSWQRQAQLAPAPDQPLLELRVLAPEHVVVLGAYGLAFESRDAGQTWQSLMPRLDNPKGLHLYSLAVQGQTWLIAGEQGLLLRSGDGGQRFERLPSPYAGSWFSVAAPTPGGWVLGGLRGHAMFSRDDGRTWQPFTGVPPASVLQVSALNPERVLMLNQAGQLLLADLGQGPAVRLLPTPAGLPPLTHVLPRPGAAWLALSLAGFHLLSVPLT